VSIRTMSSVVDEKLLQFSAPAGMLTVLAGVSLALALLGVYGVISFSLAQRRREMGIRLALGASSSRLLRTVMASGARMALAGVIGGVALAFGLGRLMASLLFGVRASDPVVLAGVGLLFGGLALLSCLIPALRVTRINPSQVLRQG